MAVTIEAIYENGVLKPAEPLSLAENEKVQITIQRRPTVDEALQAVRRGYGLVRWTGDSQTLERIAIDPEFGIEEAT